MRITVPLYVHSLRGLFHVRPLFLLEPAAQAQKLERALHQFTRDLRQKLHFLGKELRHDELARWTFNPISIAGASTWRSSCAGASPRADSFS